MSGSLDIAPDGSCLFVSFPYREDLVSIVRDIPGRRWDRASRVWKVPLEQLEHAVKIFMAFGFSMSPEVATALATDGKDTGERKIKLEEVKGSKDSLTVSQLNLRVAEVLSKNFEKSMWVVGELQNFNKGRRSKHKYFELVEKSEDELGEERLRASVSCMIWEKTMSLIRTRLKQSGGNLELEDGLKVRMKGRVELYQPRGKYQFIVDDVDPKYTLGDMVQKREMILAELTQAGLADRNKSLPMPEVPLRIALITGEETDAFNDFVQTLAATHFSWQVTLYPAKVQGEQLRPTVMEALGFFEQNAAEYDVMVLCRGGGSRSELGWWDDGEVAKAVASHPLKTVIGIGHERDQCVLDYLCTSVKTPTAAGELLVEQVTAFQQRVEDSMMEICNRVQALLREEHAELRLRAARLRGSVREGLAGALAHMDHAVQRLERGGARLLKRNMTQTEQRVFRLGASAHLRIEKEKERLLAREQRARALDPSRVLARGFAILRGPAGKAIHSVSQTQKGDKLEARLLDGNLDVEVLETHERAASH